jgi:xanthine dehydrogenase YagS FAD-binding subunit
MDRDEFHDEFRAGGTDVHERRRSGVSRGRLIDVADAADAAGVADLATITVDERGARIGALVSIASIAADVRLRGDYAGLTQAAGELATPQIRVVGTLGGNLLQRTRCWYFRRPEVSCYKKGGAACPALAGNHMYGVCFSLGPCVFPHPSTLGMAALAYDAGVETWSPAAQQLVARPVAELYGDGSDPSRDHRLGDGELLTAVLLPRPWLGERAAYFRAIGRVRAEWPLVEVVVRLAVQGDAIVHARVAVGGVAPIPMRLPSVEAMLVDRTAQAETLSRAAACAADGAVPLPMTGYKVPLLCGAVLETLERAVG